MSKNTSLYISNKRIFSLAILLTILGVVFVADASAPQAQSVFSDKFYFARQQAVWAAIGLAAMLAASQIKYTYWQKIAPVLFLSSLLLLFIVLIPGVGVTIYGAKRWISLGFASFQPSEFAKLALAIYLASVFTKPPKPLAFALPVALVSGLIMLQPDLGTTLVIAFIALVQIFTAGVNFLLISSFGLASFVIGIFLVLVSDYRRQRLITFIESTTDPLDQAYHIRQILLALGSGGLVGVGIGQSRQKFLFLPEAATDSVFAVIAEETGFIGASILILVFALLITTGLKVASQATDQFGKILGYGIIAWIGGQAILNLGSMVALFPLTGIPLPFISYGGTSLVMNLFAIGILLNISAHAEKKHRR